ncbi:MAG TPA: MBL fold metallo-hydrolase [bacterium]|nr:MBL fold metallo-hydrolase [bacterium]HPN32056.1 MBL fold metallo-hydrolase [bacterium]
MKIKFWGVRGSIPTPGKTTVRYGGNTSCIEIETDKGSTIIFDAGSGIRELGFKLLKKMPVSAYIFFSHTHWDHIQGFPFFVPIFIPTSTLKLYAPKPLKESESLESIMKNQMSYQVFPISLDAIQNMNSKIQYNDIIEGKINIPELENEGITILSQYMNHPVVCLGYKIIYDGKTIVYTGDNEPYYNVFDKNLSINKSSGDKAKSVLFDDEEDDVDDKEAENTVEMMNKKFINFIRDCDYLISDSQYTEEEYKTKLGWGHTSIETNISRALEAKVKRLILFHHEPMRGDDALDELIRNHRKSLAGSGNSIELSAAYEGLEITI